MTYEMIEDIASDVLNEQQFGDIPLFDLDAKENFEKFKVTEGGGEMPLSEFLIEFTQRLIKAIQRLKEKE